MNKRETLTTIVLAILLTFVNFLHPSYNRTLKFALTTATSPFSWWNFPLPILSSFLRKLLLPPPPSCVEGPEGLACPSLYIAPSFYRIVIIIDFLFWFLVLAVGWWVVRKIILWYKKGSEKINVSV